MDHINIAKLNYQWSVHFLITYIFFSFDRQLKCWQYYYWTHFYGIFFRLKNSGPNEWYSFLNASGLSVDDIIFSVVSFKAMLKTVVLCRCVSSKHFGSAIQNNNKTFEFKLLLCTVVQLMFTMFFDLLPLT